MESPTTKDAISVCEAVVKIEPKVERVDIYARNEKGLAKIKPEFLVHDRVRVLNTEYLSKDDQEKVSQNYHTKDGPPRKKFKGQNKRRPHEARTPREKKLCPYIIREEVCPFTEKCYYLHDVAEYALKQSPNIKDDCPLFRIFGKCPQGITCRFGAVHLTSEYKNVIDEELWSKYKDKKRTTNSLTKALQGLLWRRTYNFDKANANVGALDKIISANRQKLTGANGSDDTALERELLVEADVPISVKSDGADSVKITSDGPNGGGPVIDPSSEPRHTALERDLLVEADMTVSVKSEGADSIKITSDGPNGGVLVIDQSSEPRHIHGLPECIKLELQKVKTSGAITDMDIIKMRPAEQKQIDFAGKLYLAPLTTVGNLPFRRICKTFGADITCGEMAMAQNLLQGQQSEWALLKRHECEDIFGVQVCSPYPDQMTRCAQLLMEKTDVDFVDINVGCPIDLVYRKGAGCGLMGKLRKFEHMIYGMQSVMDVPLTVKIRTGIYEQKSTAHNLVPKLRDWGVAMTAMHGRSREQRYTKAANWSYIDECAKLASPMPFFGCGDILSYEEANQHLKETSVSGIMIARGALIKPWIFTEIKESRHWDISSNERFDIIKNYVNNGLEHWGSDTEGVEKTRTFLLEWLSFLYRYIPVGVLEQVPQKINERPPYYCGRNDMETLMASPSCADWVKISEMLLGPVPNGFTFLPKHKANSYA